MKEKSLIYQTPFYRKYKHDAAQTFDNHVKKSADIDQVFQDENINKKFWRVIKKSDNLNKIYRTAHELDSQKPKQLLYSLIDISENQKIKDINQVNLPQNSTVINESQQLKPSNNKKQLNLPQISKQAEKQSKAQQAQIFCNIQKIERISVYPRQKIKKCIKIMSQLEFDNQDDSRELLQLDQSDSNSNKQIQIRIPSIKAVQKRSPNRLFTDRKRDLSESQFSRKKVQFVAQQIQMF